MKKNRIIIYLTRTAQGDSYRIDRLVNAVSVDVYDTRRYRSVFAGDFIDEGEARGLVTSLPIREVVINACKE